MKIAILYICTGKYVFFWKDFYVSAEKFFIPDAEKHYFVFTDSPEIEFEKENKNIHKIFQENLGWPDNTLKRYEVFLKIKEKIAEFDYAFYLNANLLFLEKMTASDFLPEGKENLTACLHPGYFNKSRKKFTYETDPKSLAFISCDQGKYYFAGGINGGKARNFIQAIETMAENIRLDEKKGIIAKWHDESHWNKYLLDRNDVKILSPSYLYPEGLDIAFDKKILIRDKKKYGGHARLRDNFNLKLFLNRIKFELIKLYKYISKK